MTPTIDFTRCTDDDVAELLMATWERCFWLCGAQGYNYDIENCKNIHKSRCPGHTRKTYACMWHGMGQIMKRQIRCQCMAEIERREKCKR